MKVLVTGFEPFGRQQVNASWEAVRFLPAQLNSKIEIVTCCVPTVFNRAVDVVVEKIQIDRPDVVILVGEAGGREKITVERIGINVDDARIPDNLGNQPVDRTIAPSGGAAYFTTLPIRKIVDDLNASKFAASVSNSAGTFVCNHLLYGILHYIKNNRMPIRAGFIHLPLLQEQRTTGSRVATFTREQLTAALKIAMGSLE